MNTCDVELAVEALLVAGTMVQNSNIECYSSNEKHTS